MTKPTTTALNPGTSNPGVDDPLGKSSVNPDASATDVAGDDRDSRSALRRHPIRAIAILLGLLVIAVAGYYTWLIYFRPYESTDDAFVEARNFSVSAQVSGYLEDVPVTDNQHLDAGAIIAKIMPRDYQIALDQANGQVGSAKAAVANAEAQIEVADASIAEAQAQQVSTSAALQYAKEEAARQNDLMSSGAGTLETFQQAQATLRQAQASFNQAAASVTSAMKNKAAAEAQHSSALASVTQAEAQRESAEQNLIYTELKAAQPGRVVQLSGAKGQFVEAGQAIAMFVPDEMWVIANFKETQLTDMRPGQAVEMTIDAYPDHILHGRVASVQPGSGTAFSLLPAENATGNYVKVTQRVPVKILVDHWPTDVAIGPGMSVLPTVTVRPDH